jgi:WD40 repeat protein
MVSSRGLELSIWDLDLEKAMCQLNIEWSIKALAISPDSRQVVAASSADLRFINLKTGALGQSLKGHRYTVECLSVSPDGRRAISGSSDFTLRIWNLKKGRCLQVLEGHGRKVNAVVLSPDGRLALSGSSDATLRLWDLRDGKSLAVYKDQEQEEIIAVSPIVPGKHIAYRTKSNEVRLLKPKNLPLTAPSITPVRRWLWGKSRPLIGWLWTISYNLDLIEGLTDWLSRRLYKPSGWDEHLTALCPWCGQRFIVEKDILAVIRDIQGQSGLTPDHSPCLSLPDEAWEEPRLLSECPKCHKPLKFNPFIVDNRDRY